MKEKIIGPQLEKRKHGCCTPCGAERIENSLFLSSLFCENNNSKEFSEKNFPL
jgi:hypothetical protein